MYVWSFVSPELPLGWHQVMFFPTIHHTLHGRISHPEEFPTGRGIFCPTKIDFFVRHCYSAYRLLGHSVSSFVMLAREDEWIPVIRLETIENRANVYDMDVGNDHENRGGYTMSRENLAATWWKYMLYMWEKRENFVCDIKELRLVAA